MAKSAWLAGLPFFRIFFRFPEFPGHVLGLYRTFPGNFCKIPIFFPEISLTSRLGLPACLRQAGKPSRLFMKFPRNFLELSRNLWDFHEMSSGKNPQQISEKLQAIKPSRLGQPAAALFYGFTAFFFQPLVRSVMGLLQKPKSAPGCSQSYCGTILRIHLKNCKSMQKDRKDYGLRVE